MRKILVTGGTVFVSKYVAEYYVNKGEEVYVLNRGSRRPPEGTTLIKGDRNELGDTLRGKFFDVIIDVNAYTQKDVADLLDSGVTFGDYVFISSSAVYPEYGVQPFQEDGMIAENQFWGDYGTDKIEAERLLRGRVKEVYIIRPPYLYGKYNNVYREAFVFDCAMAERKFYLPGDGSMKLQFFHVDDLCRLIDRILEDRPDVHIFNVGNEQTVSIREWVSLCYEATGKAPEFAEVHEEIHPRKYFCFADYEYTLDVGRQKELLPDTKPLAQGLKEAFVWYQKHEEDVNKRPYMEYIDNELAD